VESARFAVFAEGLEKRYGKVKALDGLDLRIPGGKVCGLLGPNGAGKTTAVRILSTLLRPDGGRAEVAGFDVVRRAGEVRYSIGLAGQQAAVDEILTGRQNLETFGRLYHLGVREARRRADDLLERFGLADAVGKQAKNYSGGMRRRLDRRPPRPDPLVPSALRHHRQAAVPRDAGLDVRLPLRQPRVGWRDLDSPECTAHGSLVANSDLRCLLPPLSPTLPASEPLTRVQHTGLLVTPPSRPIRCGSRAST
jgi:hypothetical protein